MPISVRRWHKSTWLHRHGSVSVGFTIVELLIVIVVIAILAALSMVAYNSIQSRAVAAVLRSDVKNASTQLEVAKATNGVYPSPTLPTTIEKSDGTTLQYTSDGSSYCVTATSSRSTSLSFMIRSDGAASQPGTCPGHTDGGGVVAASHMQTISTAECPAVRTMVVDGRDNRTYWVQKLADDRCWMLTNLAYAGGGANTYGDTKTLQDGTSDGTFTYTAPKYYMPAGANPTSNPTEPSAATTGTGQYGYLYNWCAAMGGQLGTGACTNTATPLPSTATSVCPANWRLPVSSEFGALTSVIGATSNTAGATVLRTTWLAQYGGSWANGFANQGSQGRFWSLSHDAANTAFNLYFHASNVNPAASTNKYYGFSVRCVAD